ncbi:hypothetical protein [Parendozoicomonas haliclonae]|uniref:Uncharacterized protein n=1 Tax=Parendozoicomonas haliclonae TaxID=1960125 RepID=A0A1X7AE14_9GAMM|nr:hypothetical protein [Parendozoicomonas haliclonae]SMA31922.1 hypothetical protein EHSB41UT_00078 [Parendozoicomonas haliclonae]
MVTGNTSVMDAMEERVEDILTMYAAGVMSRMEEDYIKGLGWAQRAEEAAFQLGVEARQSNRHVSFGVPKLDKAYIQGRAKASAACKVYDLNGEEISTDELPKSA